MAGFRSRFRALMPWTNGDTPPASANGRETRSASTGYTDLVVAGLLSRASGERTFDPASLAAIESAAGIWSRAMMSATVEGDDRVQSAVTPTYLKLVARQWIRNGDIVHVIALSDAGKVTLLPCASWDVNGGPGDYWYRCDLYAPSSIETVRVEASGIVHSQWATHPTEPWRGVAPWQFANLSAGLLAALERSLAWEAATPVGQLFPQPDVGGDEDPDDDDEHAQLRTTIANLEGAAALVPTTASGGGLGPQEAPRQDWRGVRVGAAPPDSLVKLREAVELSIYAACGVPAALADIGRNNSGTLARESWRRFITGAVEPMANELAGVLSAALETPVRFTFRSTWAHDLVGRTGAFSKLIAAGMPPAQARILSGLSEVD